MSHQRAPGFGRPSQLTTDGGNVGSNLNIVSSGFWSKSPNLSSSSSNPFCYTIGNQLSDSPTTSSSGSSCRFDQSSSPLFKDEFLWKHSSYNPISIPAVNQSRPLGVNVSTSSSNHSSTINNNTCTCTPLNNSKINGNHVKSSIQSRDQSTTTHDLLAQFLGLCLDNQQKAIPDVNLNSQSLSFPHGSSYINKLIDSAGGAPSINQSNSISWRKLKARSEENTSSTHFNISLDHYNPTPTVTTSKGSGSGRRKNRRGSCIECVFCKNNGQPASFYQSHVLKDVLGRVTCPILSAYDCPICHNGGGPKAHTVRYCPENKPSNRLRNALLKSQIG